MLDILWEDTEENVLGEVRTTLKHEILQIRKGNIATSESQQVNFSKKGWRFVYL